MLVFLAGILAPIWKGIPDAFLVQDLVAFAGAGLAVFGFTLAWDARQARRADPSRSALAGDAEVKFRLGPSAELYSPGRDGPSEVEGTDEQPDASVDEGP